ncbi:MAG: hypothetical protein AAF436_12495 [Myxococcota bacterium]
MNVDVGVGQLVRELEQRGDRLPFEIGAFVALEACEGLLQESVTLQADDVRVTAEGSVVVASSAKRAEPDEAARSLVSVLQQLLVAAGPGVPPYLLQLVRESATGEPPRDLKHLHDAIEASLIPLNRGASRRVLARLVRESERPPAPEAEAIDPEELDAELDELLGDPGSRSLDDAVESKPGLQGPAEEPVTARITIPRPITEELKREARPEDPPEARQPEPQKEHQVAGGDPDPELQPVTTPPPEEEPERVSAPAPRRSTVPPPLPPAAQGSVVVSEHVMVDSAPPPSQVSVAAAAAPVPQDPEEAVTATIRVRFPEQEPQTAKVPIDHDPPPVEDAPTGALEGLSPASEAVLRSATETTQQWALTPPRDGASEDATPAERSSEPASAPVEVASPTPSRPSPAGAARTSWIPWLLVLTAAAGLFALFMTGAIERPAPAATQPNATPLGTITANIDPADAQVFVFVGRGPARATGLAPSATHEFVVFDNGLEPSRTAVPSEAPWQETDDGPQYELAVQARAAGPEPAALSLGVPLHDEAVAAQGDGVVRVITNPPGAKVYRYLGQGPQVSLAGAPIHEGTELLVFHPEYSPTRAVIGPSDWRNAASEGRDGSYTADVDVSLTPLDSQAVADPSDD